jgi:hypothetical protein
MIRGDDASDHREIIRADPTLRRRALLATAVVVALGLAAITHAPSIFQTIAAASTRQSPDDARRHAILLIVLLLGPFTVLAVVGGIDAIRRSVRTLRTELYPPPGTSVLRDTPVIRGPLARVLGVAGAALGCTLLALGLILPWMGYRVGRVVLHGCPRATSAVNPMRASIPSGPSGALRHANDPPDDVSLLGK